MAFERVYGKNDIVRFNKIGDSVEGLLVDVSQQSTKFGGAFVATLKKEKGIEERIIIADLLWEYPWDDLVGKYIKVVFSGWERCYRGDFMKFDMFVDYDRSELCNSQNG